MWRILRHDESDWVLNQVVQFQLVKSREWLATSYTWYTRHYFLEIFFLIRSLLMNVGRLSGNTVLEFLS